MCYKVIVVTGVLVSHNKIFKSSIEGIDVLSCTGWGISQRNNE